MRKYFSHSVRATVGLEAHVLPLLLLFAAGTVQLLLGVAVRSVAAALAAFTWLYLRLSSR